MVRRRGSTAALAVALGTVAAGGTCWVGGYSREYCCNASLSPRGNPECWDAKFQYEACCLVPDEEQGPDEVAAPLPFDGLGAGVLEPLFGPKLDAILASGATLDEMEEGLRQAIATPDNRQVSAQMARNFLALTLHRKGRRAEAAAELQLALQRQDFQIAATGAWVGASAAGCHMHDPELSGALAAFLQGRGARTVADFGCGLGLYVRDLRRAGLRAGGFDGNPSTGEITEGRCLQLDLSREVDLGTRWDWVLSLEVAEHIPQDFEERFLGNLERHACAGLVLSWSNEGGEGHVNLRPRAEVVALLEARGFRALERESQELRDAARLPWLRTAVVAFERAGGRPADGCGR